MDYKNHYDKLMIRARNRTLDQYTESHHIVPRCMGGSDESSNLVALTPEEHYIAHLLLLKIHPDHDGLVWAAVQMTRDPHGNRSSNKMYGWLKRKYQQVAKARTGEKNGSTGTIWINKTGTTENKKIKGNEPIPEGWEKGRKIKTNPKTMILCVCGRKIDYRSRSCRQCKEDSSVRKEKTLQPRRKKSVCQCLGCGKEIISKPRKTGLCRTCYNNSETGTLTRSSKLDKEKVSEIRRLYATGEYTIRDLASEFCVSNVHINRIINFKTWKF